MRARWRGLLSERQTIWQRYERRRRRMEHEPDELGRRMRLADALVDQGCYQEAVEILEAARKHSPQQGAERQTA